jgi:hypothetical protein
VTCGSPGSGGARVFVDQVAQDGFSAHPFSVGAGCPAGFSRQRSSPACRARRGSRARCGTPARLSRTVGRGPQVTLISDLVPSPARAAGVHARSIAGIRQAGQRSARTGLAPGGPGQRGQRALRRGKGNLMNHNAGWALQRSLPGRQNGRRGGGHDYHPQARRLPQQLKSQFLGHRVAASTIPAQVLAEVRRDMADGFGPGFTVSRSRPIGIATQPHLEEQV